MTNNQRNTLLKFLIAVLLASVTSALPTDAGLLQNSGVQLGCTENCNSYAKVLESNSNGNGTEYSSNGSNTLSITTGMGFLAMFLWTLLSLL